MQFPLLGSASLFSLYLAFKFFDRNVVNMIISVYFGLVGCAALTVTFSPILGAMLPKVFTTKRLQKEIKINHPLPQSIGGESPWDFSIDASLADILAFIASVAFSVVYLKSKHWALNNVLGIAFCLQGIERFSLGTYKIGAILLVGLFFYDIFWVFGTDVMVTVAKNLDGPIKILFPRSLVPNAETGKIELSLLGLGGKCLIPTEPSRCWCIIFAASYPLITNYTPSPGICMYHARFRYRNSRVLPCPTPEV